MFNPYQAAFEHKVRGAARHQHICPDAVSEVLTLSRAEAPVTDVAPA